MTEDNTTINPILDDKLIGRNLYLYRKMADMKTIEVAGQLGLKESAYSKYHSTRTRATILIEKGVSLLLKFVEHKY